MHLYQILIRVGKMWLGADWSNQVVVQRAMLFLHTIFDLPLGDFFFVHLSVITRHINFFSVTGRTKSVLYVRKVFLAITN